LVDWTNPISPPIDDNRIEAAGHISHPAASMFLRG